MRAWELSAAGLEYLTLNQRPDPEPGDNDVVVRIKAASLNYRDWMIVSGTYPSPTRYPIIPLSDGAGDIVAIGRKVTDWRVGDRVISSFFSGWIDGPLTAERGQTALGGSIDGVLAETVVLPARGIVRTPKSMTDVEAATLPCAALHLLPRMRASSG